jgi:hypothetical protein
MNERPSSLRVFGKSLRVLALGWVTTIAWLWVAEIRQHVRRHDVVPADYALATLATGTLAALVLEGLALAWMRWTGAAGTPSLQRREWRQAFWWAVFPNLLLLYSAYVMIFGVE